MNDKEPKPIECKHEFQFDHEWDIGNSWGGADYMYVFECVHCGEIKEDTGNDRPYHGYEDDDGWR